MLMLFLLFPTLQKVIFVQLIFPCVRYILDFTIGLLPFPFIYILVALLPLWIWFYAQKFQGIRSRLTWLPLNIVGWLLTGFMWFWGFHYTGQSPFVEHDAKALSQDELYELGSRTTSLLQQYPAPFLDENLTISHEEIQDAVVAYLSTKEIPCYGKPSFYEVGLHGLMRKNGVAGIYLPFSGQAHIDGSFLAPTKAFIIAHELAHAYGISAESDADFVAFMALYHAQDERLQCIAQFELYRAIRSQLHMLNDSLRIQLDSMQSIQVMDLIKKTKANALQYPEFFPGLQEKMNDRYLKMMGIEDGIRNYDHFIDMIWQSEMIGG